MVVRRDFYNKNSAQVRRYRLDIAGLALSSGVALEVIPAANKRVSLFEFQYDSTASVTVSVHRQGISTGGTRAAQSPGRMRQSDTTFAGTVYAYSVASTGQGAVLANLGTISTGAREIDYSYPAQVSDVSQALTIRLSTPSTPSAGWLELEETP